MIRRVYDRQGILALQPAAFLEAFFQPPNRENAAAGDVAVVNIRGPLEHRRGWWCDSYEEILERVEAACAGPARAIVLRVDSPGGECAGAFDTARAIRARCAAAGKRLLAYVDGRACSAGYAMACAAEQIHVTPTALVGSIGVISARVDVTGADAAQGVRVALITSGARKADGHPHSPISDAELAETGVIVDALAAPFFDLVAEMRALDVGAIAALQAGVFVGPAALERGLADAVGTFESLLAMAASGETSTASAGGVGMDEDEKSARDALQAIIDGDGDEKAKARAKKALAAMDESDDADAEDQSDDAEDEGDEDDKDDKDESASSRATVSAKTAGALAGTANDLAARLAALEAERETEKRSALLASRKDLPDSLVKVLQTKPLAEVQSILDAMPKPKVPKAAAAAQPGVQPTRAARQTDGVAAADNMAWLDRAMGLNAPAAIKAERRGNTLFLGPAPTTDGKGSDNG